MAGYQFAHLEAYSRKALIKKNDKATKAHKWSTREVFAEALREAGACSHVDNPSPPVLVFGQSLEATEREHDERCSSAVDTMKNGKTRKIRETQNTLLTVVLSHPDSDYSSDVQEWERLSVDWLRQQYGDQLKTVVRHDDEGHEHLHAYIIPDDLKAIQLHPGEQAKQQAKQRGQDNKEQNNAYKQGFRDWQNSYCEHVGKPCGLARLGPGKRRLSREAWRAEQQQSEALKTISYEAEQIKEEAKKQGKEEGKTQAVKDFEESSFFGRVSISVSHKNSEQYERGKKDGRKEIRKSARYLVDQEKKEKTGLTKTIEEMSKTIEQQKDLLNNKKDYSREYRKSLDYFQDFAERVCEQCQSRGWNISPVFRDFSQTLKQDKVDPELIRQIEEIIKQVVQMFFGVVHDYEPNNVNTKSMKKTDFIR